MKSFWNALKKVGSTALTVEHIAIPIVSALDPALAPLLVTLDGWVNRIHGTVLTLEANSPADGSGQAKLQSVITDFEAGLGIANAVAAGRGKKIVYDQAKFNESVGHLVAFYNGMGEVKASFTEEDLNPTGK